MARMSTSFAVMGDTQFLPGYSLALVDRAGVGVLSDLPRAERLRYVDDVERLADAVEHACREHDEAFRRVNIEILGNSDPFLHAHVWPRYDWEPAELVRKPVWLYPASRWSDPRFAFSAVHLELRKQIARNLAASG
ncbi:Diadenosine tetraphosphate (Ap4A) hydrolase [Propionibacterium cyclohexanicum]|uniref:Diadenosine tetraphosphate (Ap4A) hydrolase n=2 Tax=Propionibacterium cyclohexanicum TaxID=64702 RepID=A0A1H9QB61_9ACTN|nr:Diadenosine tetraphosphate (Ap4A) hydrolase [Propionibacterium cyclohexanicum]